MTTGWLLCVSDDNLVRDQQTLIAYTSININPHYVDIRNGKKSSEKQAHAFCVCGTIGDAKMA